MSPRVLTADYEVVPFLESIGLDREGLVAVVLFAEQERALCTANDVRGWDKQTVYDKAARGLRDCYCGQDWERDEYQNQAGIRNAALKIRIVPCNFDHNAGKANAEPTNRVEKGEASKKKARCNKTGWLPGLEMPEPSPGEYTTYFLGIYAETNEPLGAELSLPLSFDKGQLGTLVKRVMLLSGDQPPGATVRKPDREGPIEVIDIAITRK